MERAPEAGTASVARHGLPFDSAIVFDGLSDGVYVVDRDWRLLFINASAERCFKLQRRTALGQSIWQLLPGLIGTEFERQYRRAMSAREAVEFVTPAALNPGRFIEVRAFPTGDGLGVIFRDVSDQIQTREALEKAEERLRDVTDAMPALLSYFDADQVFRFANKAYEARFARPLSLILGHSLEEVFGPEMYAARRPFIERALAGERVTYEAEFDAGTQKLVTRIEHIPHIDDNGVVLGVYSLVQDITEYRRVLTAEHAALARANALNQRLEIAHQAAGAAAWDWDLKGGRLLWTNLESARAVFGPRLPDKLSLDLSEWLALMPESDRAQHMAAAEAAIGAGEGRLEFRMIEDDGRVRWFETSGRVVATDEESGPLWMSGVTVDITKRKQTEDALREHSEALEVLNATGATISSSLELEQVVQAVTDAGVVLSGAEFGAFFYRTTNEQGRALTLYALSGADDAAFSSFPHPRPTEVFAPTFNAEGPVRSDDITRDPRYGRNAPFGGMPKGHLPVRSYLAVPVVSRSGEAIGGLFFGHGRPGVFTERAEALIVGLASQAAIAIDNARLFEAAQTELRERKRVEGALRETERRLNAVLDNATVAIFLMNERQECVYMNSAAEKLTGFSLAETSGRPLHDVIHHTRPDGSHFPIHECAIDRAFPENNQQQGEEVFVRPDGSFYPVAFTASPIRDDEAKTIGTIIEVRDVTEEKRNQRARDLLMREVDHRARNALAVVQSIVQLTKAPDIGAFQETLVGRVQALARAQGSLAEKNWHGAELREVVESGLSAVAAPGTYALSGPEVMLLPDQVQPISMITHELATNARKYGALSAAEGQVQVEWVCVREGIEIVWREQGGPPVVEPDRSGFGSRLVRQLAAQLGADLALDWRASGLQATLRIRRQARPDGVSAVQAGEFG